MSQSAFLYKVPYWKQGKVQLELYSSNNLSGLEGEKKFSNKYCPPMSFKISITAEQACNHSSPVRWKVHKRESPTEAPENRSVRLRDLNPEQRGVHYPHSTTTERLDSILQSLPVMRSPAKHLGLRPLNAFRS